MGMSVLLLNTIFVTLETHYRPIQLVKKKKKKIKINARVRTL